MCLLFLKLFFPTIHRSHWFVFLVDLSARKFIFLDSKYDGEHTFHTEIKQMMVSCHGGEHRNSTCDYQCVVTFFSLFYKTGWKFQTTLERCWAKEHGVQTLWNCISKPTKAGWRVSYNTYAIFQTHAFFHFNMFGIFLIRFHSLCQRCMWDICVEVVRELAFKECNANSFQARRWPGCAHQTCHRYSIQSTQHFNRRKKDCKGFLK